MTPQKQFLQSIDNYGSSPNEKAYADVHISYYNLDKVKKLKKISKLRWVTGTNMVLVPGSGSGTLTIGKEKFKIVYAWGGRNAPDYPKCAWEDRTSYTVRIEGPNIKNRIEAIRNKIIAYEEGRVLYNIKFRDYYQKQLKYKTADCHLRRLKEMNESLLYFKNRETKFDKEFNIAPLTDERIQELLTDFKKRWKANRKEIVMQNQMKRIETDMI